VLQQLLQRQRQQNNRTVNPFVLSLAISQIKLFKSMAIVWPTSTTGSSSSLSSSEELGSAALPVLDLALVLLNAAAAHVMYVMAIMDFVTFLCNSLLADLLHTGVSAAAGQAAVGSSSSSSSSSSGDVPFSPGVQQLLQSEQLPKLLAATQALHVLALSPDTTHNETADWGHS
jgi:hypothetical protein